MFSKEGREYSTTHTCFSNVAGMPSFVPPGSCARKGETISIVFPESVKSSYISRR